MAVNNEYLNVGITDKFQYTYIEILRLYFMNERNKKLYPYKIINKNNKNIYVFSKFESKQEIIDYYIGLKNDMNDDECDIIDKYIEKINNNLIRCEMIYNEDLHNKFFFIEQDIEQTGGNMSIIDLDKINKKYNIYNEYKNIKDYEKVYKLTLLHTYFGKFNKHGQFKRKEDKDDYKSIINNNFKNNHRPLSIGYVINNFFNYLIDTKPKWLIISKNVHFIEYLNYMHSRFFGHYDLNENVKQILLNNTLYDNFGQKKNLPRYMSEMEWIYSDDYYLDEKLMNMEYEDIEYGIIDLFGIDLYNVKLIKSEEQYYKVYTLVQDLLLFRSIIILLNNLKIGGNIILQYLFFSTKLQIDIYSCIKNLFNEIIFDSLNPLKPNSIIFKGYKNNVECKKTIELLEKEYKKLDKKLIEYDIDGLKIKKIKDQSFIKNNNDDVKLFQKNYKDFINNVLYGTMNEAYYLTQNKKDIELIKREQLYKAIKLANQLDLEIKPEFNITKAFNKFHNSLIYSLFSFDTIQFKIRNPKVNIKLLDKFKVNKNNWIDNLFIEQRYTGTLWETRDQEVQDLVDKELYYYGTPIKKLVSEKKNAYINGKTVSQAWLKMYEMLHRFNLFDENQETIKGFHACEAPGNFILAFNHYIKTKTNVKKYIWYGQTYKPDEKFIGSENQNACALGDRYGLIKKYSDKWDFGALGNGDINQRENVEYYRKKYNDVDIVTQDCGIPWRTMNFDGTKLIFSSMLFVFRVTPKHKNSVFKIRLKVCGYSSILSMICLLAYSFKNIYFYKPLQNSVAEEFYIICKDYINILSDSDYNKLADFVDNFDLHKEIIDLDGVNEKMRVMITEGFRNLLDKNIFEQKRVLYYIDNYREISSEDKKRLIEKINKKNEEWMEEFEIERIENKDKL